MSSTNGRCNSNERGSSYNRRVRKYWLLDKFGDGVKAPCADCGTPVTYATMIVDRIIPGYLGGRYTLNNIQIHCQLCSCRQGQRIALEMKRNK